jgi:Uma2 family endonuclease
MDTKSDIPDLMTAEQLATLPDGGARYELVEGELRMMSPAGGRHGRVAIKLALLLANHVLPADLGAVYAAETGFILTRDPDTVRAPDVAFVAKSRLAEIQDERGFVPFAPDLAGEVISPNESFANLRAKALAWLAAGTRLVLLVDPEVKQVHVYRGPDNIVVLGLMDQLDADDVVAGWRIGVADLFV